MSNGDADQDAAASRQPSGFTALMAGVLAATQGWRHFVELASASIRLAAMSAVSILIMALIAAVLLVMTWLLVVSVIGYVLLKTNLSWIGTGLILAGIHLVGAAWLMLMARAHSRDLTLPAVREAVFPANKES